MYDSLFSSKYTFTATMFLVICFCIGISMGIHNTEERLFIDDISFKKLFCRKKRRNPTHEGYLLLKND